LELAGGVLEFSERTGYLWNTSHDRITGVSSLLLDRFRSRPRTSKTTWRWRVVPMYGYATPFWCHFHVVFDVRVLDLNLSINIYYPRHSARAPAILAVIFVGTPCNIFVLSIYSPYLNNSNQTMLFMLWMIVRSNVWSRLGSSPSLKSPRDYVWSLWFEAIHCKCKLLWFMRTPLLSGHLSEVPKVSA
jgi:hypothetical protein